NIAAVGVIGALWITLTILPALLLMLPLGGGGNTRRGLPMGALAEFVVRRQRSVFWLSLLAIALAVAGVARIEFNDDPSGYFSQDVPLKQALGVLENRLSGLQSLHYSLDTGVADGITEPAFLADVERFADWLRAQPEVVNVQVFTDTLKRLNEVMHNGDPQWKRLPDSRAMAAQYTLLYEISVPYGQDVTHQMSADKSALKLTATLRNQKSRGIIDFEQRSRAWLAANAPALDTRGSGQAISFANVGLRNISSMLSGSLIAILMISACLVLALRSLRFGLVSLIPNLFPAFVALGLWGWLVGEVNIAASVVFSLTLGIIVDDTTHFLVKYTEARRTRGLSAEDAVRYTFSAVGGALVCTSIVLAIGFLALVQSDFSVNATSGLLVAATIAIAIVLDLLF
ncbi:MAG: MMPL family transporter, partial [Halioglobus sp.]|nr:MMPL family transporter [Halioglobus sp.]